MCDITGQIITLYQELDHVQAKIEMLGALVDEEEDSHYRVAFDSAERRASEIYREIDELQESF